MLNELGLEASTNNNLAYTSAVTAVFGGNSALTDVLVSRTSLNLNAVGVTGNTLLMWASLWGQYNVARSLLQQGADYSVVNNDGLTALQLAANSGHVSVVQLLRGFGAN